MGKVRKSNDHMCNIYVGGPLPEFNFKKMLNVGTAEKNWNQGN